MNLRISVLFASLWFIQGATAGPGTNSIAATNDLARSNLIASARRERQQFVSTYHPLRVVGGKLYRTFPSMVVSLVSLIQGVQSSVSDEGYIVIEGDGRVSHVRNYTRRILFDGDRITCCAIPIGRYQYQTAGGALSTVRDFDYGHFWDPARESFTNKTLIYFSKSPREVPVWEIDRP